jgi:hypothetical protein
MSGELDNANPTVHTLSRSKNSDIFSSSDSKWDADHSSEDEGEEIIDADEVFGPLHALPSRFAPDMPLPA